MLMRADLKILLQQSCRIERQTHLLSAVFYSETMTSEACYHAVSSMSKALQYSMHYLTACTTVHHALQNTACTAAQRALH